jgi:putative SOS response-associated peptidase YedK
MCGRFTITRRGGNSMAAELGVSIDSFTDYRPRYNLAPTQDHFVVAIKYENRIAIPAQWDLLNRTAKDAGMAGRRINARAETVQTRATIEGMAGSIATQTSDYLVGSPFKELAST